MNGVQDLFPENYKISLSKSRDLSEYPLFMD